MLWYIYTKLDAQRAITCRLHVLAYMGSASGKLVLIHIHDDRPDNWSLECLWEQGPGAVQVVPTVKVVSH